MKKELINKYCRKLGFEIHGTGYMQSVQKNSFKENAYEKQKEILGENIGCIFDIGANRGDTVMEYHRLFPRASVYAFEPFPDSFNTMIEKVKDIKQIFPIQKAIGELITKTMLYVNNSVDTNSLLPSGITGLSSDKQVANKGAMEVEVYTADQFCVDHSISHIDILKLDIQGGELAALKGTASMLEGKKVRLIYLETYFIEQYIGHPLFHDVATFLYQHGYRLQDFYDPYYGKGSIAWCDAIFL